MSTVRPSDDASIAPCDGYPRLTRSHRSRLIKSTRKLANILGENPIPQVNLSSPISSPQKKFREGSAGALYSPILSLTKKFARAALDPLQIAYRRESDANSEEELRRSKSEPADLSYESSWSPVLVLRAESSVGSETDGHASHVSSQVSSPTASSFRKRSSSLLSTSTSKSFLSSPVEWERRNVEWEARRRRKRLSKLARHLGESIPPDLVLSKPGPTKSRRGFLPALSLPVTPVVQAESPKSQQETFLFLSPSSSLGDVPRPAVEKTVEVFESTGNTSFGTDAAPSSLFSHGHSHSESSVSLRGFSTEFRTDGYFEVDAVSLEDGKELETCPMVVPPPKLEPRLAFLRLRPPISSPEPSVVSHRRERRQGWSGEWNAASMQDVISKLRDLR